MKEKIVIPYAPILVESTRSIGYSFEAAVADIIDNSISASATEVHIHIHDTIKEDDSYAGYYTDVEYNRNRGGIKTIRKTIRGQHEEIITINCDLILHSRGGNVEQDNLIAIEMKKSTRRPEEKQADRERLMALTKDSFDDVWAWNHNLPEHVCRYTLGVYYEINYRRREIEVEYYHRGELVRSYMECFAY